MRKFLILVLSLILAPCAAFGATLKMTAELLEPFSSENPPEAVSVRVIGNYSFNNKEEIEDGSTFAGYVTEISEPKRGKRNGYFYCRLTSLIKPSGQVLFVENEVIVKVKLCEPIDKKEIAISAGTTVAGLFVKHITYPINFVRGAVSPQEGKSRMASGAQMMYEKSVISYISKGKEMALDAGDNVILVFKYDKNQAVPNDNQ